MNGIALRPIVLSFFYTGIFCAGIGVLLWTLNVTNSLEDALIVSFCIGFSIVSAQTLCKPLIANSKFPWLANAVPAVVGLFIGWALGGKLVTGEWLLFFETDHVTLVLGVFFGVIGFTMFGAIERLYHTRQELQRAELERREQDKQAAITQLKLLQAQIEPHFLFNTLANVIGLVDDRPEAAKSTLVNLITLLRSSLNRTRQTATTLGEELEIVRAFLDIQKIRMATRLTYEISCPGELKEHPFPPLLIQPLVENAVKHGIDPKETGGEIRIEVVQSKGELDIRISDTGVGIDATSTSSAAGTGIVNVEQRLAALYGPAAQLKVESEPDGGVVVSLLVPTTVADDSSHGSLKETPLQRSTHA